MAGLPPRTGYVASMATPSAIEPARSPATTATSAEQLSALVARPSEGIRVVRVPVDGAARREAGRLARETVVAALGGRD